MENQIEKGTSTTWHISLNIEQALKKKDSELNGIIEDDHGNPLLAPAVRSFLEQEKAWFQAVFWLR